MIRLRPAVSALSVLAFAAASIRAQESVPAAPAAAADAGQPPEDGRRPLYVLTIGNSFSDDATAFLPELARHAKTRRLELRKWASLGGHSLQQHAGYLAAWRADPKDPNGRRYNVPQSISADRKADLATILRAEKWDVVTIQQVSHQSFKPETYFPYAEELAAAVKEFAPGAKLVLHQTWAYRPDDGWMEQQGLDGWKDMHARIRAAYRAAADRLGIDLFPVGDAFAAATEDPAWGYAVPADRRLDLAGATNREALDAFNAGSLHVGYRVSIHYDPRHASAAGRYLGAAVWYEMLFGESVVGNPARPGGLTDERAALLQRHAHEAVEARRREKPAARPE